MKLLAYLREKYQVRTPTIMLYHEMVAFHADLDTGWLARHGNNELGREEAERLHQFLLLKASRTSSPIARIKADRAAAVIEREFGFAHVLTAPRETLKQSRAFAKPRAV